MANPSSMVRLLRHKQTELPRDGNGVPSLAEFETFLTVTEMRAVRNVRSEHASVWAGRPLQLASGGEIAVKLALEANFFVLDIREGYPQASEQVYRDMAAGKSIARNRIPTFDFVVTLAPQQPDGPLRYRALWFKPRAKSIRGHPEGQRRMANDSEFCRRVGWTLAPVSRPTEVAEGNYLKLWDWARQHPLDDGAQDAKAMGRLLSRSVSRRPLWSLLQSCGKKLGIRAGDEFFVFAAAFYLGYVGIDQTFALDEELPYARAPAPMP